MPLLSVEFALFFLAFLPIYWGLAKYPSVQNLLLLAAGMGWLYHIGPVFAAIIVLYSSCVYLLGELLRSDRENTRRFWLGCGIAASLTVLGFFKYFDFFRPMIAQYAGKGGAIDILMPLGLSYYTFQSLAYLVYCFRAPHAARFSWHELLLHLSFFPTVTSGPIIRAAAFKSADGEQAGALAQIRTRQPRSPVRPALAVSLILLGIAKKWWLAGMLAENWVSPVFENPAQFDGWGVLAGVYGYTFQLFLDFSGYSDLVIGMAMLLGFRLPKNFSAPLRALNIRAFWDKWHISLSTWIRDYIYIPLGGSKKGFLRTQLNLMAAMVLSGIWHGYGWNFLIWGALHGTGAAQHGRPVFRTRRTMPSEIPRTALVAHHLPFCLPDLRRLQYRKPRRCRRGFQCPLCQCQRLECAATGKHTVACLVCIRDAALPLPATRFRRRGQRFGKNPDVAVVYPDFHYPAADYRIRPLRDSRLYLCQFLRVWT